MKNPSERISAIAPDRNTFSWSRLQRGFLLLALGLGCALAPTSQAVSPPPDGGYPNFNTAEGEDALLASLPAPTIRRLALTRSISTQPASLTPPPVLYRSSPTRPVAATPPTVSCALKQHHRHLQHRHWCCTRLQHDRFPEHGKRLSGTLR